MAPHDLGEIAASTSVPTILSCRHDVTVVMTVPLIAFSDIAIEAVVISARRGISIIAVDIAGQGIARETSQNDASHNRAAIAMADRATDQTTGDRTEDCPGRMIVPAALVGAGRGRAGAQRQHRGSGKNS